MAKIACFGCSWTHGATFEIGINWVNELARSMPDHEFFNLSHAGSSLLHSIWIMEQFKKYQKVDFTIFQITTEGRKTYYLDERLCDPNFLFGAEFMRSHSDPPNLKTLCLTPNVVQSINYGTLFRENAAGGDPHFQRRYDFAKTYYETFDRPRTFDLEHKIYSLYVKDNSDLSFFHTMDSMPYEFSTDNNVCIQHVFGKDQFMNYSSDGNAYHLTQEGCQRQAEYIQSLISSRL